MRVCSKLEEYTGIIGKWRFEKDIDETFDAKLVYQNGNYVLLAVELTNLDIYTKLYELNETNRGHYTIYGTVNGIKFSLINYAATVITARLTNNKDEQDQYGFEVEPDEIIFGEFYGTNETEIVSANVYYEKITQFFDISFYEEHPEKQWKDAEVKNVELKLNTFKIRFSPTQSIQEMENKEIITHNVVTEMSFSPSVTIATMRIHIVAFRMLLSILKLNYVRWELIEICLQTDKDLTDVNQKIFKAYYHMNNLADGIEEIWPVSFCLRYEDIVSNDNVNAPFASVVCRWFQFFSPDKVEPIVELFYQQLINKSDKMGQFSKLARAFEVYSRTFREKEAKSIQERLENPDKNKDVKLFYRIYDLLFLAKECFKLSGDDIEILAGLISKTRNQYIHNAKVPDEEAFIKSGEQGVINRLMTYYLAILLYYELGISLEIIQKNFYHTYFEDTIEATHQLLESRKQGRA